MDRAHAPDKWFAVDRDYFSSGEKVLQCVDSSLIVGVTKDRCQDDVIGDVEICVARRQALTLHHHRPRERQRGDSKRADAG